MPDWPAVDSDARARQSRNQGGGTRAGAADSESCRSPTQFTAFDDIPFKLVSAVGRAGTEPRVR